VAAKDIARVYASSLVELGQSMKILPELEEEIKFVAGVVKENADFRHFLVAPGIAREAKKDFIDKVFKGNLSETIVNFVKVLIDNDRQACIVEIGEALSAFVDQVNNRQQVTIVTSAELDPSMKDKLTARLKEIMKKDIILKSEIKADIIGGIIIKVGDTVIDGSLAKDLRNIKNNLLNSKVRSEVAYED
jgi:F-type H+-transporting ATPase subunit delta